MKVSSKNTSVRHARKSFFGKKNSRYCKECSEPKSRKLLCDFCDKERPLNEIDICKPCGDYLLFLRKILRERMRLIEINERIAKYENKISELKCRSDIPKSEFLELYLIKDRAIESRNKKELKLEKLMVKARGFNV